MSTGKGLGPESAEAFRDWVKSYVASAINGGVLRRILWGRYT